MLVEIPVKIKEIMDKFVSSGYEIYIVGGAVRDILMKNPLYDWDFTTSAHPEEMLNLLENAYYTNEFGTVGIPNDIEGERPYEITTFRTEYGYSDTRHPDKIEWGKTLQEDLARREATISAMALRIALLPQNKSTVSHNGDYVSLEMDLIDPYNGQQDIKDKLFRAVGDPDERYREDALRMIRAIRISSHLGFEIEKKTLAGIIKNAPLINKISKERVRDELLKILKSAQPDKGIMLLRNSKLLQEILPEIEQMFGVEQKSPGRHHIYDVGTHSLLSLKYVAEKNSDPIVRLATLIHDIGKPQAFNKLENGIITFYNHEIVSSQIAKNIADRLRFPNKEKERLFILVRYHQFTVDEHQTDSAIKRFIRKVGIENIGDILDLRIGDRLGGGASETSWRLEEFKKRLIEVQKQPFTVHDLKIDGHDVMKMTGIKPGPGVGQILQDIFEKVENQKLQNQRKELISELKKIKVKAI